MLYSVWGLYLEEHILYVGYRELHTFVWGLYRLLFGGYMELHILYGGCKELQTIVYGGYRGL